ncbi:hypothetical protein RUND412_005081 [Rhizina undulata]
MSPLLLVVGFLVLLTILIQRLFRSNAKLPPKTQLPPGPPGIPILGNLLQIPPKHSWLLFKQWADQYGPIFRFSIAGRNNIVLSTEKIANDLLRERGNYYSSREHLYFAGELLSHNLRPLFLPYNDLWRRGRKLMHNLTMTKMANSYQPAQSLESKKLLNDLLSSPSDYERHFERYAAGLIFRIGFGKTVETGDEPHIHRTLKVVHHVERTASPGAYLCDSIPILRYLPEFLAPFKKEGRALHEEEMSLFGSLQEDIRREMERGEAPDCFTKTFLEKQSEYALSDEEGAYVIGTLFEAGSGTTAAAMMSFCLAMVLHPEWQAEGWKEVDEVCGDRMPEFDDLNRLPYVRAVVKEVLRWRPVTAGGIPHQLVKDDVYDGLFFPAGTTVHANQWAIHRDPTIYPDPETFNPRRWLDPSYPTFKAPLDTYPNLQNFSAFGFGRRICPGMNIAERSLYILTARILWACQMGKKKDVFGRVAEVPLYDYTEGFNVQPKKFEFVLTEREGRGDLDRRTSDE